MAEMKTPHIKIKKFWILSSLCLLIAGCVGVGVFRTDEPFHKLNHAEQLFQRDQRALIAENLIWEAKEIGEAEGDYHLIGNVYYTYARFLVSSSVEKWNKFYRENGFKDESIAYENRKEKSREYLEKAAEFYNLGAQKLIQSKEYDKLTNFYLNAASVMQKLDKDEVACDYMDRAIEAAEENILNNPQADPYAPPGYESLQEYLEAMKKSFDCM